MADGFLKSFGSLGEMTGLDKTFAGLKDVLGGTKLSPVLENKPPKLEGDKLQEDIAAKQATAAAKQEALLKEISNRLEGLKKAQTDSTAVQRKTYTAMQTLANKKPSSTDNTGGGSTKK